MTDLEKFVELYQSLDIPIKVSDGSGSGEPPAAKVIALESGDHSKLVGYSGFGTEILFDKEGKFISQGFWE